MYYCTCLIVRNNADFKQEQLNRILMLETTDVGKNVIY
jgi:hypothetical protein